jgi:hypothetical protein
MLKGRISEKRIIKFGFEVLRAVTMKSTVFWDTKPCSLITFTDVSEECTASIFRGEE